MAGEAFAILNRQMLGLRVLGEGIMAGAAQAGRQLEEHLRIGISVGIMARSAFAILGGLMFDLLFVEEIVVARKANFGLRPFELHGHSRLVALTALVVLEGRMRRESLLVCMHLRYLR